MNSLEKYDPNSILNEDLELAFSFLPLETSCRENEFKRVF